MSVWYGLALTLIALFFLGATYWFGYQSGVRDAEERIAHEMRRLRKT
jgi:hypothetical protein